jgi:hypothetical protein
LLQAVDFEAEVVEAGVKTTAGHHAPGRIARPTLPSKSSQSLVV